MGHTPLSVMPTKEAEPITTTSIKIEPTLPPQESLHPEVQNYLKKREDQIRLPQDLEDMGLKVDPTDELQKTIEPHLVLTDVEIMKGQKMPITSSYRWLAELMSRMLHQTHKKLQVIHGHVKRVMISSKA